MKTYIVSTKYDDFYRAPDHLTIEARDMVEALKYAQEVYPEATSIECVRVKPARAGLWATIKRWFA
jgi:hypothetical protein